MVSNAHKSSEYRFRSTCMVVLSCVASLQMAAPVRANDGRVGSTSDSLTTNVATLEVGQVKILSLCGTASKVFVGDQQILAAQPNNGSSVAVIAKSVGSTTIIASNDDGDILGKYYIIVTKNAVSQRLAQDAIHQNGDHDVKISGSGEGARLSGQVDTPLEADEVYSTVQSSLPKGSPIQNDLKIQQSVQVNLRVRIVEMSRSLTRALGVNWKNLGGDLGSFAKFGLTTASSIGDVAAGSARVAAAFRNTDIEAVIDAMSREQIVRTLAQPNLTTVSGQSANFLVGGEFPIPISSGLGQVSVRFKTYGISLTFLPTVLSSGQINLKVKPEVSYLTDQGAVTYSNGDHNITIPALDVRRAETTVQLGSGESFAIAGLLRDVATSSNSVTPFLGNVPILGALFRSDSFKHEQTELVIIVTPYVVRPVSSSKEFHMPDENFQGVEAADRFFTLASGRSQSASSNSASRSDNPGRRQVATPVDVGFEE
ncbi:hypothetical protein CGLAMM_05635 [Acetobacteraceae bacterium EV16G]|uniref:Uncharacterized protein n=1 Tax=Sorlinia euscelidii TaxID=3081148 RepID=A0ABU7U0U2_9PROT